MIHLKRDYIITLHVEPVGIRQLYVLQTMYEQLSIRQLDYTLEVLLRDLDHAGMRPTCAEVTLANNNERIANTTFMSLMNIPEPVTKGGHHDNGNT